MTVKTCDICGVVLDEDYTRYHYSYDLGFMGKAPHQLRKLKDGSTVQTLVCYPEPKYYRLNLCQGCGMDIRDAIETAITSRRESLLEKEE